MTETVAILSSAGLGVALLVLWTVACLRLRRLDEWHHAELGALCLLVGLIGARVFDLHAAGPRAWLEWAASGVAWVVVAFGLVCLADDALYHAWQAWWSGWTPADRTLRGWDDRSPLHRLAHLLGMI